METNQTEQLAGKKVVVLGGSAGIGLATAKAAAAAGAWVTIVSSNQQRLSTALESLPAGSKGVVTDLGNENQVQQFFNSFGRLDHLVYTAGEALSLGNISDTVVTDARNFFNVRYWGALTAVKYGAPFINAGGSVVLTGGIAGARPGKGWAIAASICSAMEGFTRAMAIELAPIRVNIVVPGLVKTDLWRNMPAAENRPCLRTWLVHCRYNA